MRVFLAFLAGAVVSYFAIVAGAFWYMDAAGIFDRDGGMAMGIVFAIGPIGAAVGGTIAALIAYFYGTRSSRPEADSANNGTRDAAPQARATRIGLVAVLAGAAGYLAGRLGVWLQTGTSYESYWMALLIGWSPLLLGLAAATLAGAAMRPSAIAKACHTKLTGRQAGCAATILA